MWFDVGIAVGILCSAANVDDFKRRDLVLTEEVV